MTGDALRATLDEHGTDDVFAIVATGGTTNYGVVDDIRGAVEVGREHGIWVHVDGAYGLAALCAPSARPIFDGIEGVDSFIVDPHKWLFAPFDACALLYRDPTLGKAAHTQTAGYLEAINEDTECNPSDYAVHLSRRARGLPLWFSLATHGTQAYTDAVERTLAVARSAADGVRQRSYLELVREPNLSVVVFRRLGWKRERLLRLVGPAAGGELRVRAADDALRRDGDPLRGGQPPHDGGRRRADPRHHGRLRGAGARVGHSLQRLRPLLPGYRKLLLRRAAVPAVAFTMRTGVSTVPSR